MPSSQNKFHPQYNDPFFRVCLTAVMIWITGCFISGIVRYPDIDYTRGSFYLQGSDRECYDSKIDFTNEDFAYRQPTTEEINSCINIKLEVSESSQKEYQREIIIDTAKWALIPSSLILLLVSFRYLLWEIVCIAWANVVALCRLYVKWVKGKAPPNE